MKNRERWMRTLSYLPLDDMAVFHGAPVACADISCEQCDFCKLDLDCGGKGIKEWLDMEVEE